MAESKRQKFIRLAESRTNNALKQIDLLGNLANTSAYEFTYNDIEKIVKTLKNSISDLERKFSVGKDKRKFSLR